MDKKQIFNRNKSVLIWHSFNRAYNLNSISVVNKIEPKVIQYVLTTNSALDLSLNTFKLEKHFIKAAFKTNFCQGQGQGFASNCDIQTVQMVLHYSNRALSKTRLVANKNMLFARLPLKKPLFLLSTSAGLLAKPRKLKTLKIGEDEAERIPGVEAHLDLSAPFFSLQAPDFIQNKKVPFVEESSSTKNKSKRYLESIAAGFCKTIAPPLTVGLRDKDPNQMLTTNISNSFLDPRSFAFAPVFFLKHGGSSIDKKWTKVNTFKEHKNLAGSLVRADWVLGWFVDQLSQSGKKNPRSVMNQLINEVRILIEKMGSECPIIGARVTITGRLGSRKKGMAQQISKCVGKVPLSTLRQRVDYSQTFLPTRLGLVGIKIWVCYK